MYRSSFYRVLLISVVALLFNGSNASGQTAVPTTYDSYLDSINISGAWNAGYTGSGVLVGIVDDSMQMNHSFYSDRIVTDQCRNYSRYNDNGNITGNVNDCSPYFDNDMVLGRWGDNHGTAVTGCVAAYDTASNTYGPAYQASVTGIRLNLTSGSLYTSSISEAMTTGSGTIKIKNNSWGFTSGYSSMGTDLINTIDQQTQAGTIITFAAGNNRASTTANTADANKSCFTANPFVISVAALGYTNNTYEKYASFSDFGSSVFVCAPGDDIQTSDKSDVATGHTLTNTFNGGSYSSTNYQGYVTGNVETAFNGTSAATPIVSGVLALVVQAARNNPSISESNINTRFMKHLIAETATKLDLTATGNAAWTTNGAGYSFSPSYGFGEINASEMCSMAANPILMGVSEQTVTSSVWFRNSNTWNDSIDIESDNVYQGQYINYYRLNQGYLTSGASASQLQTDASDTIQVSVCSSGSSSALVTSSSSTNQNSTATPLSADPVFTQGITITDGGSISVAANFADVYSDFDEIGKQSLEEVIITLAVSADLLGDLQVSLESPSGTSSILVYADTSTNETNTSGDLWWSFTSNAFWGEDPLAEDGVWTLTITDAVANSKTITVYEAVSTFYMGELVYVPEPSTWALLILGGFGLMLFKRRK